MHIAIDLVPVLRHGTRGRSGGAGRYVEELAAALVAAVQTSGDQITFFTDGGDYQWLFKGLPDAGDSQGAPQVRLDSRHRNVRSGILRTNISLRPQLTSPGIDVFHEVSPNYMAFAGGRKVVRVVTIHDMMPILMAKVLPLKTQLAARLSLFQLDHGADRVITDSVDSARDILEYVPDIEKKLRVVYLGADPSFRRATPAAVSECREQFGLPSEYLLYLGKISPNKNTGRVLQAYAVLRERSKDVPPLVVAGTPDRMGLAIPSLVDELNIGDHVKFLGFVPDEYLPALLTGALMLVFVPVIGGFGLPVLEGLACGTPVVTSNCSSLPEITGETAVLVDPRDPEAIADGILRLLGSEEMRKQLIAEGPVRAGAFSWEKCATDTLAVYREAVLERSM